MADIFLKIVNMSISACWIVLAILLFRVILKKAPKWISCVLWGIAGLRLVMPFSFESIFSLIPSAEFIPQNMIHSHSSVDVKGTEILNFAGNNPVNYELGISDGSLMFTEITAPDGNYINPLLIITYIASIIWLAGIFTLSIHTLVSFLRLKNRIETAVLLRDNIYQSEAVVSPFVLGVVKPKIYLPYNINKQYMEHVIAHEQAHIHRKDHFWKPLGFLILTLHWFNPTVWLGYILLCRDIELACDEKVVKEFTVEQRADYSEALLTCSVNRRIIAACPLAFGEIGVKDRVKSIISYKKPAFRIIFIAIIASILTAVCFLTDPLEKNEIQSGSYKLLNEVYSDGAFSYIPDTENNRIEIKNKGGMHIYHFVGEMLSTGALYEELKLNKETRSTIFGDVPERADNENLEDLLKNNKKAWYDKTPDDIGGYPYILLLQRDGTLYMAFADFENGEPTSLRYVYELEYTGNTENGFNDDDISVEKLKELFWADIPGIEDTNNSDADIQNFRWIYRPMLSYTGHSFYPFKFDLDYTHVIASCENGYMQNLEADGQPKGSTLQFSKGQHIYWTPEEAVIERIPQKTKVILKVYNGETELYQCSAVFECISSDAASAEFRISLKVADGLTAVYDDGIKIVKKLSISDIGSADAPLNITATIDGYPFFIAQILEIYDNSVLVKAVSDTKSIKADTEYLISTNTQNNKIPVPDFEVGLKIAVIYDGEIFETNPTQINSVYAIYNAAEDLTSAISPTISYPSDKLTAAISAVLKDAYRSEAPDGLIHIENYYIISNLFMSGTPLTGNSEHIHKSMVYLLVYNAKYSVNSGTLKEVESGFVPTLITFGLDENNELTLEEYWIPRSGENYEKDIRDKFPEETAEEALHIEKVADKLKKENLQKAYEYLKNFGSTE